MAEALDENLTPEVECIDRMHVNPYRRSVHVRLAYRTPRQNDAATAGTGRSERHIRDCQFEADGGLLRRDVGDLNRR